ncbi:MAG: hypothetical protein AAF726_24930 [Planctomycetota bacterium]
MLLALLALAQSAVSSPYPTDAGDGFGLRVLSAGDVDADGTDDLIVQQAYDHERETIHVVSGARGNALRSFRAESESHHWIPLGPLGDTAPDGAPTFALLEIERDGWDELGCELRVLSARDGRELRSCAFADLEGWDAPGLWVKRVPDVDDDGVEDLLAMGFQKADRARRLLRLWTLSGRTFDVLRRVEVSGIDGPNRNWSVAGDLDDDGAVEVAVRLTDEWGYQRGLQMISGSTGQPLEAGGQTWGRRLKDFLVWDLVQVDDVDGDGVHELVALHIDVHACDHPRIACLVAGSSGAILAMRRTGLMKGDGAKLRVLHDWNGDGVRDVLALDDRFAGFHAPRGHARVLSGRDLTALCTIEQQTDPMLHDHFGLDACAIGDVDGDDVPDLAISANMKPWNVLGRGAVEIRSGRDGTCLRVLTLDGIGAPR